MLWSCCLIIVWMERSGALQKKSFVFSVRVVRLYQFLCVKKREFNLSKQILRSGTSIGANIEEAIGGISKADFSAKISIAYKEARETNYWLELLYETDYLKNDLYESLSSDCEELLKLLFVTLRTSRFKSKE